MKVKFPSITNSNPLIWKCKIFGCRDEFLPVVIYDSGERHGITEGLGRATAAKTFFSIGYKGCHWCHNYKKIVGEPQLNINAGIWLCDCDICVSANQHRKWLYE